MVLPNQLTVLRIILTPVFLYLFLTGDPLMIQISLVVFLIAAITDWYDGWLARKFNYITEWGKFLDPLADKVLTSTAFLGFVFVGVLDLWMVILIIFRDLLITGLRSYAEYRKVAFTTSYTAKWKTFMQMVFLYYLLLIYTARTIEPIYKGNEKFFSHLFNQQMIFWLMLAITVFTVYTGISYIINNRSLIKKLYSSEN